MKMSRILASTSSLHSFFSTKPRVEGVEEVAAEDSHKSHHSELSTASISSEMSLDSELRERRSLLSPSRRVAAQARLVRRRT